MTATTDLELKVDLEAAQKFLDAVAVAARAKFAIVKPGEVVVLECEQQMTDEGFQRLKSACGGAAANLGIKLLILPKGVKVAQLSP